MLKLRALIAALLLPCAALAQSPGTLSLSGPSTGGSIITPAAINAAINAALAAKADAAGPVFSGVLSFGDAGNSAQGSINAPLLNQGGFTNEYPGTVLSVGTAGSGSPAPLAAYTPNAAICNVTVGNCSSIVIFGQGGASLTTDDHIVALGVHNLMSVTDATGNHNVGGGIDVMRNMTAGHFNVGFGERTMTFLGGSTATASSSTAVGYQAMFAPSGITNDTAVGYNAFGSAGTGATFFSGANDVAVGAGAGTLATTAGQLVLVGAAAGANITTGGYNTLLGNGVAPTLTTGTGNIVIGVNNAADVPTAGTSGMLIVQGTSGIPTISAVGINTSTPVVKVGTGALVSQLPACTSSLDGYRAWVTDASAPAWNSALTGGGSVHVIAACNGSAWTAH